MEIAVPWCKFGFRRHVSYYVRADETVGVSAGALVYLDQMRQRLSYDRDVHKAGVRPVIISVSRLRYLMPRASGVPAMLAARRRS